MRRINHDILFQFSKSEDVLKIVCALYGKIEYNLSLHLLRICLDERLPYMICISNSTDPMSIRVMLDSEAPSGTSSFIQYILVENLKRIDDYIISFNALGANLDENRAIEALKPRVRSWIKLELLLAKKNYLNQGKAPNHPFFDN